MSARGLPHDGAAGVSYAAVSNAVHRQQNRLAGRDTTLGAVAAACQVSVQQLIATIDAQPTLWVCYQQLADRAAASWPCFVEVE